MDPETFKNDLSLQSCIAAYSGISMSPEKSGQQTKDGYAEGLVNIYETLEKQATTEEKKSILAVEFERFRTGYRARYSKWLASMSRCMSTMISGRSNFPVRQQQKRSDMEHNRLTELLEYKKRALTALNKALHPELRPIMAGDDDATTRLKAKIEIAVKTQTIMREVNATIRKHKAEGPEAQANFIRQVMESLGVNPEKAATWSAEILKPDFCGRIGFATFELTNNKANINRMKGRLAVIERNQAEDDTVQENAATDIRVETCPAENRIKIFFPGKPDEATRTALKRAGFRWAPTEGCWKAYINWSSKSFVEKFNSESE